MLCFSRQLRKAEASLLLIGLLLPKCWLAGVPLLLCVLAPLAIIVHTIHFLWPPTVRRKLVLTERRRRRAEAVREARVLKKVRKASRRLPQPARVPLSLRFFGRLGAGATRCMLCCCNPSCNLYCITDLDILWILCDLAYFVYDGFSQTWSCRTDTYD